MGIGYDTAGSWHTGHTTDPYIAISIYHMFLSRNGDMTCKLAREYTYLREGAAGGQS
jgi:hypothetical protein